jgi:hypothetical protein
VARYVVRPREQFEIMPEGRRPGVLRSEFGTEGGKQGRRDKRGALALLPTELLA